MLANQFYLQKRIIFDFNLLVTFSPAKHLVLPCKVLIDSRLWGWYWFQQQYEETFLLIWAPNKDLNQPFHQHSPIRVSVVRMKKLCIVFFPKQAPSNECECAGAGRTCSKVRFLMLRPICYTNAESDTILTLLLIAFLINPCHAE